MFLSRFRLSTVIAILSTLVTSHLSFASPVLSKEVRKERNSALLSNSARGSIQDLGDLYRYTVLTKEVSLKEGITKNQYLILVGSNSSFETRDLIPTYFLKSRRSGGSLAIKVAVVLLSPLPLIYPILDTIIRRTVDLSGPSWAPAILLPAGYYSNKTQVDSSLKEIRNASVGQPEEIMVVVRKNLFNWLEEKLVKTARYEVLESNQYNID